MPILIVHSLLKKQHQTEEIKQMDLQFAYSLGLTDIEYIWDALRCHSVKCKQSSTCKKRKTDYNNKTLMVQLLTGTSR